jgi:hypothetical protein
MLSSIGRDLLSLGQGQPLALQQRFKGNMFAATRLAARAEALSSLILERMPPGVTVVARRWGGHVAILDQV